MKIHGSATGAAVLLGYFGGAAIAQTDCQRIWNRPSAIVSPNQYFNDLEVFTDSSGTALFGGNNVGLWRWDGKTETNISLPPNRTIFELASIDDGTAPMLYIGTNFGAYRWDGAAIQLVGNLANFPTSFALYSPNGTDPRVFRIALGSVDRLNGNVWTSVGALSSVVCGDSALAVFDDGNGPRLFAGGFFVRVAGITVNGIAAYDGNSWSSVGGGATGALLCNAPGVTSLVVFDDGSGPSLFASGAFTAMGGQPASGIARWDGLTWSSVGSATEGGPAVWRVRVLDAGDGPALYAFGDFSAIGGVPARRVARWDGQQWSAVGGGVILVGGEQVLAADVFDDGAGRALYVGGTFTRVNGVTTRGIARYGCICPDFDADGLIGLLDLTSLLSAYGGAGPTGDTDRDGDVDLADLSNLLAYFGESCP